MAEQTAAAESSPALNTTEDAPNPVESLSDSQREEWLKTGDLPDTPASEASATSTAEKATAASPASATGNDTQQVEDRTISPAEKRIKQLLARNKELEAQLHRPPAPSQGPAAPSSQPQELQRPMRPKAPTLEQYNGDYEAFEKAAAQYEDTFDRYMEDLSDYKAAKRIEAERQAYQQRKQAETIQEHNEAVKSSWETRQAETIKRHPDFEKAVKDAALPLNPIMDGFIVESEVGPEIVYWLAKNPVEGERIASLGPFATARELSRIEMTLGESLKTPAPTPKPTITAAFPPPTTLSGTNKGPEDEARAAVASKDFSAYRRAMNSRELTGKRG